MSLKNSLLEKNYRLTFWLCVLGLMWITAFLATAEEQPQKVDASDTTSADEDVIDGTADDFERYEKKGITILIGHVKINMPAGFLNSDKATLHEDVETGDIVKTVAEGNVELRDGEALATCDYAIIYHLDDIIDLQHNVIVTQNEDRLTAKHVIYERRVGKQISEGTVKINRPDGFLNGDKVTMFRNIETNELLQTLAEGNVELRDKEIFATCDHATITHTDETVNLRENVVVIQNKDRLETKHFTYNQKTGEQIGKGDVKFKVRVKRSKKADETSEKSESEGEDKK